MKKEIHNGIRGECCEILFPPVWEEKLEEINILIIEIERLPEGRKKEFAILEIKAKIRALEHIGASLITTQQKDGVHYILDETG